MDLHLNFIVDQTEKYSSWLIESLANNTTSQHGAPQASPQSVQEAKSNVSPAATVSQTDDEKDEEFDEQKFGDESDDESTIEKEEQIEVSNLLLIFSKILSSDLVQKLQEILNFWYF